MPCIISSYFKYRATPLLDLKRFVFAHCQIERQQKELLTPRLSNRRADRAKYLQIKKMTINASERTSELCKIFTT
jgi:hypothetical protein